jgi:hypothetical protein
MLDNEGRRFYNELGRRDQVTGAMWTHNKGPYRLVLNSTASKEIEWHCKHYAGRGLMKHYKSASEFAKDCNIPLDNLNKTLEEYEKICQASMQSQICFFLFISVSFYFFFYSIIR